jgi:transglutaminase-like putative cysteine protease
MKLTITHTTTFTYDAPVSEAYMEMRLMPLDAGGQRCESFRLTTDPPVEVRGYADHFGNRVRHFDTLAPHERLVVSARSEVSTPEGFTDPDRQLSLLDAFDYLAPTDYTPLTVGVRDFAATCGSCASPDNAYDTARTVMRAVNRVLAYVPGSTNVKTTAEEALGRGRGVCQDFAHLMIAACRALGLPARYVSGYVFSPRRGTAAASHAWIDVFVAGRGWVSLDPTHDSVQTDRYVRLAVGRDYSDVPPTRGVYKGAGQEEMSVDVSVETS